MDDKEEMFSAIKKLLKKHSAGLDIRTEIPDSNAKQKKEGYHLYGKNHVSIGGRKPQWIYVAGIIMQKNFVGFYHMPMYSHAKLFPIKSAILKKARKGKACLNLTKLDDSALKELDKMIADGKKVYKKEGWL